MCIQLEALRWHCLLVHRGSPHLQATVQIENAALEKILAALENNQPASSADLRCAASACDMLLQQHTSLRVAL